MSKELGLKQNDLLEVEDEEFFGSWFCNLVVIGRRKCLLFCHSKTLYCFFVPCVVKSDLKDYVGLFCRGLRNNLEHEGFAKETIQGIMDMYSEGSIFSKTNSRSVLGTMNDYVYLFEAYSSPEGPAGCDIMAVNRKINTAPMSAIKYSSGIKELRRLLMRVRI